MGIPFFYKFLIKERKYKDVKCRNLPNKINSLMIDGNGTLHKLAQEHYAYGIHDDEKKREQIKYTVEYEEEFFDFICSNILKFVDLIKPINNFVFVIDGVAPIAKIFQQRERRLKSTKHLNGNPVVGFDSNCITPGTTFMTKLDKKLRICINENINKLPGRVIYSPHNVRGEGEHEIFQLIRDGKIINGDGYNIIVGMDADLIILSLLSSLPRIILCREDVKDNLDIDKLRISIVEELLFECDMPLDDRKKLAVQDFALLTFFIGNDFIKKLFIMHDVGESIQLLMKLYYKNSVHLTTLQGNISWDGLGKLLISLKDSEKKLLIVTAHTEVNFPYSVLMDSFINGNFDFKTFRTNWYGNIEDKHKHKHKHKMCLSYFKTLQWNLNYYLKGEKGIKSDWSYNYYIAPLAHDLSEYLMSNELNISMDYNESDIIFGMNEQLLSVIPKSSYNVLPEYLLDPIKQFEIVNSHEFNVIYYHKTHEWESVAILPFIDIEKMHEVGSTIKQKKMLSVPFIIDN
jgi:5'-3' exoribonuclease 1